jgi:hypothetical protein
MEAGGPGISSCVAERHKDRPLLVPNDPRQLMRARHELPLADKDESAKRHHASTSPNTVVLRPPAGMDSPTS